MHTDNPRQRDDEVEGLHPNDGGYQKMAQIWYQAITAAPKSWYEYPSDPASQNPLQCDCTGKPWYQFCMPSLCARRYYKFHRS